MIPRPAIAISSSLAGVAVAIGVGLIASAPAHAEPNDPWHNSSCDSLVPFYNPAACQQAQVEWQREQSQYGPCGNFSCDYSQAPDNFDAAASSRSSYGIDGN